MEDDVKKHSEVVLPAHAGVILEKMTLQAYGEGFTRTRGGDPDDVGQAVSSEKFYPHTRG